MLRVVDGYVTTLTGLVAGTPYQVCGLISLCQGTLASLVAVLTFLGRLWPFVRLVEIPVVWKLSVAALNLFSMDSPRSPNTIGGLRASNTVPILCMVLRF